jgi:NifU-like protein involved in Fe-S cluster formation
MDNERVEKLLKVHLLNPKNCGEISDADFIITHTNSVCGDCIKLYAKVNGDILTDVKYKVFGCSTTIAVCSILTEFIKNKNVSDLLNIKEYDLPIRKVELETTKRHAFDLVYEGILKLVRTIKGGIECRSIE